MKNFERWAILLELIKELNDKDSWCGETHIQKSVFFLQELKNIPLNYDFIIYKYGPFSFELSDEITALRAFDFIEVEAVPPYGVTISIKANKNQLGKLYSEDVKKYKKDIEFIASQFGNKSVVQLEKLATAYYLFKIESLKEKDEIVQRLRVIKPHISVKDAEIAVTEVMSFN